MEPFLGVEAAVLLLDYYRVAPNNCFGEELIPDDDQVYVRI